MLTDLAEPSCFAGWCGCLLTLTVWCVVVMFILQVSPQDCTGCELCVHVCPDDALTATPILDVLAPETANWDFMHTIPNRGNLFDKSTVSSSAGFVRPDKVCAGCCVAAAMASMHRVVLQ